jgi:hypothetical protein
MYKALIQPMEPVSNNKLIWKKNLIYVPPFMEKETNGKKCLFVDENTFKAKVFAWYRRRGSSSLKTTLLRATGKEAKRVYFFIMMRQLNTYFFNDGLPNLYGQSSKWVLPCICHVALPIFLVID